MTAAGFWVGVVLLFVVAPCCAASHGGYRRRWRVARTVPVLTCDELRSTSLRRVAVAARTSTQDVIGEDRIWYRTEVRDASYDSRNADHPAYSSVTEHQSGRIVIDDGTGTAELTPRLAETRLTGRHRGLVNTESSRSSTDHSYDSGYDSRQEKVWFVRPGVEVFAIGRLRLDPDGTPVLDATDPGEGAATCPHADVLDYLAVRIPRWVALARAAAVAGFVVTSLSLLLTLLGR